MMAANLPQVHQFATSLTYGDAISDEMLQIRGILLEQGYGSDIFVRFFDPRMAGLVKDYREYSSLSSPNNVVIFHFSIGSPVSKLFFRIPDKKIMIYHNITPHEFFLDSHRILARECYKGRLEIRMFKDRVNLALGDSDYNRRELEKSGYSPTGVLPLLLDFSKFKGIADPVVSEMFADPKTTILFVGRVIPNKKFEDCLKTFYWYKKLFNPSARLILAGDYRGMERYFTGLKDMVASLKLTDVHFPGHTSFAELLAFFNRADIYLSMSEHEGFGVPLLEAFAKRIPVIAYAAGAVEETMNGGGILLHKKDFTAAAGLIDMLSRNRSFRERILTSQDRALRKYRPENVSRILLEHVKKVSEE